VEQGDEVEIRIGSCSETLPASISSSSSVRLSLSVSTAIFQIHNLSVPSKSKLRDESLLEEAGRHELKSFSSLISDLSPTRDKVHADRSCLPFLSSLALPFNPTLNVKILLSRINR